MHKKVGEDRTCSFEDMIADRQTHRQTDTLITILRSHVGGGVKMLEEKIVKTLKTSKNAAK